jgi:membrane protein
MATPDTARDAAAISYFFLFTLFPSVLVVVSLVDAFLGWVSLRKPLIRQIIRLFPGLGNSLVTTLSEISDPSPALLLSCLVLLGWTSTWVFSFIENGLNRAWGAPRQRSFWQSRVRSTSLMILAGLLLLASAGLTAFVSSARLRSTRPMGHWAWSLTLVGSGFLVAILVFWLIYKLLPDRRVRWIEAFSGAMAAAVLWETGSYIFGMLVPFFDYQRIYGRAGAIMALLTWIYTSNLILLFGANFSAQWHRPMSGRRRPAGHEPRAISASAGGTVRKIRSFPPPSDKQH